MDCYNQFQFYIAQQRTFSTADSTYSSWSDSLNQGWVVRSDLNTSVFKVQGFKNINLHGVKMVANIQSGIATANKGIVDDYKFFIELTGQTPSISGEFTTNGYGITTNTNDVFIGKYNNEMMFAEPIKSCTEIRIHEFQAQGYVPANSNSLTLSLFVQFYFYYKFEGENEDLLY
jgi:hypothetical protein